MNYTCWTPRVGETLSRSCGSCGPCLAVRAEVALAISEGTPMAEVARRTGRPRSAIYLLMHRHRKEAGLQPRRKIVRERESEEDAADYTLRPDQCPRCFLSGEHVCLEAPSLVGSTAGQLRGAVKW